MLGLAVGGIAAVVGVSYLRKRAQSESQSGVPSPCDLLPLGAREACKGAAGFLGDRMGITLTCAPGIGPLFGDCDADRAAKWQKLCKGSTGTRFTRFTSTATTQNWRMSDCSKATGEEGRWGFKCYTDGRPFIGQKSRSQELANKYCGILHNDLPVPGQEPVWSDPIITEDGTGIVRRDHRGR